jgi:hypothetical protein
LFSIRDSTGAQADGFSQRTLERRDLAVGGPELQLGVPRCAKFKEVFSVAIVNLHSGHRLGVTPIQRFSEAQNGAERSNGAT